jgi:hypothetical protein
MIAVNDEVLLDPRRMHPTRNPKVHEITEVPPSRLAENLDRTVVFY